MGRRHVKKKKMPLPSTIIGLKPKPTLGTFYVVTRGIYTIIRGVRVSLLLALLAPPGPAVLVAPIFELPVASQFCD